MRSPPKYRFVAFALAVVFAVFNIGVPVVLASCPMPKNVRGGTCFACYEENDGTALRFTKGRNTSCCLTVIAAERNTTAFIQAKKISDCSYTFIPVHYSSVIVSSHDSQRLLSIGEITESPPALRDIPIITSSLLI